MNKELKKVGVLVKHLGPSQLSYYFINNSNKLLDARPELDIISFYENPNPPCITTKFATMQIFEAWNYDGIQIATTLSTADKLIKFPVAKRKIFYVWDLEWIRNIQKDFDKFSSIYSNPGLELVARSYEHKSLIESCWNVGVKKVVENFNMEELISE